MDIKLKQTALQNLARTAGETAQTAIRKELAKIIAVLQNETTYDHIADQLELLDTIGYRVHEELVGVIKDLLKRLEGLELTYEDLPGFPTARLHKYNNNLTLMVKALEVLENIRYYEPFDVLDIFFEYSCHQEESVAKQATHGVEKLAEYELGVFYGNGKDWPGLGWEPQLKVLEKITFFDNLQKEKYFSAIVIACEQMLSPTVSGTSSTYKTFTFRTGAIPAIAGIKDVRKKTLNELQSIFALATNVEQKKAVLNAMEKATQTPHMGDHGDDVLEMIMENTITVAEFMKTIVVFDDMQLMQKIEHDAYWLLYRKGALNETVRKIALEIRDMLYTNGEYQIFRILIGFESVFHDWEKSGKESEDFERERKFRETEAAKLAQTIDIDSYKEWKERIIRYASIKSNDMATFPYFGKFLEQFGKASPGLALQILLESSDQLERFMIAILSGVAETERKGDAYSLIAGWCSEGKYLFSLARFFEFSPQVDEKLLKKILDKAVANNDLNTLNQIISTVSAQYSANRHLIKRFFVPALEILTIHKNSGWIFGFWFRKQRSDIMADMETDELKVILDNLFWLREVDYHAEEILYVIAKRSPELVIQFFCNRLSKEEDQQGNGIYDAIPFSFHQLSEALSQRPVKAINAVLETYDARNYGLFIYRGARLLKNIFPDFPPVFQQELLKIAGSKKKKDLLFVMAILRNYDGNPIIHNVCKNMVEILPERSSLKNELGIIMESTGVVMGEYGFVEAYRQKIAEIQPWLHDESPRVKAFAQNYIASLEKRIEREQKRADENITLRKHQYGSDEE